MDIHDAYDHWSLTYDQDQNLTRDLDLTVTRRLLTGARCRSILEIGCGTGKNTSFLADLGERVLALDFSDGMLARARAKVQADHVTFETADLTLTWPCLDQSTDLVVCNLVLEHIADLDHIFEQAARVLMPGGRFFLCELHPFRQYQGIQANFQGGQGVIRVPAFIHHLSDFTRAASRQGLAIQQLDEWWHEEDEGKPPRLISMTFRKL